MSNIKHIHLFRNGTVIENRDSAVARLKEFINGSTYDNLDGVAILARYKSSNGVKTLVGFVYGGNGSNTKSITIFDNEGSSAATDGKIGTLKEELKGEITKALTSANTYTNDEIAKLDVTDHAAENNFVTSVSETDGKIEVTRAAVTSKTKTVSVTKNDDGGVSLDVNIDNSTIVKNAETGVLSVASTALTQYVGENAVTVSSADTSNNKTVSLKINSNDKVLSQDTNGLSATLSIAYDSNERKLQLKGKSDNTISEIDATAFVKDGMLNDTAVFTASATKQSITFSGSSNTHEYSGLTINHHYLAFEFKISSGESSSYNYEILDATSIIDVYNNGNGLELTDHTFSVKKADDSEGFLTIDEHGVKISGVTDAIAAAAASAKTEVKKADNDKHINVTTSAVTDGHVIYTISSVDTASATDLANETSNRKAADDKIEGSVGLNADGSHKTAGGYYTSGATTVVGEIEALDAQVKTNADNIAQNTPKGSNAITVTNGNGSTIAVKLSSTDSGLAIKDDGLAINFESLELDCGIYQ